MYVETTEVTPCLQCGDFVISAGEHHHEVTQESLAVLVDQRGVDVESQEGDMEEEGQMRGPVHLAQLLHQLRQEDEREVTPA